VTIQSGTRLGPYEILSAIGAGGMGEVWKARDTRLGRIVAIKQLMAPDADRFDKEARAIAALNHPHICQVYDVGPDYLVLEYIEGHPLCGPLPADEVLRLAIQIAGALEGAHSKGILHRDLKPANIMVTEGGSAKLLDFGLAKLMDADADMTRTLDGTVIGTAAYMAPEQAEGKPLDARSDVFSFGAVLYEMLSGARAFPGTTTIQVWNAVLRDDPSPLQALPALDRLVRRCLAKQPGQRFQTMTDVRLGLEQAAREIAAPSREQHASIAVLPFANMSRDPDDEFFSDGLAEELINLLAHVPNLKVTARTSAFAFRGKEQDIRRIAEALGVRTILEGSVRRAGSRVRVTAQLINAEDGYHLWSERYDRELTDVFAIQDDIAQAIAGALQLKLVSKPARHTPDFPAYEALLKARHHARTYLPEAHARAKEYCEQSIALDPEYAAPHALLGFNYLFTTTHTGRPMPDVAPLIRREASRALELDPFETDPHFLLGAVAATHDYNWLEAAREFQLTMARPSSVPAEAHWAYAGLYLSTFGRFEESTAEMRRAVEKDPLSVIWRGILMGHLVCAGKYEEALKEGLKALEIADNEIHPHLAFGEAYLALGRLPEAVASAERAHRNLPQQSMATGFLAACLVRVGEKDRAEALLRAIGDTPTPIWGRAWYHLLCSEIDAAASWYEKMIEARDMFAVVYANSLYTEELRASPHWARLARMMNLPASTV
jgi:TolB-like protein/tRNA A-37 threonylcarbamoyl transferase component Bud32